MGSVLGSGQNNQELKLVVENMIASRKQNLVTEITNYKLIEIRDYILASNDRLQKIYNQINQDLKFSIASTGSYRGQKGSDFFIRQGFGETIGDDQNFYKLGEWKYDALEGYGCSIYVKDDYHEYYIGNFQKGRAQGQGELKKSDRSYYKGSFSEGKPNGNGTIFIFQNSCYNGEVLNGKMHGKGEIVFYKDQVEYIQMKGEFENDQMIQGELKNIEIGIYTGQMKDGKFHGKGVMKWIDGSFYDGQFQDHKRHGLGVFKQKNNQETEWWFWENDEKKQKVNK